MRPAWRQLRLVYPWAASGSTFPTWMPVISMIRRRSGVASADDCLRAAVGPAQNDKHPLIRTTLWREQVSDFHRERPAVLMAGQAFVLLLLGRKDVSADGQSLPQGEPPTQAPSLRLPA